MTVAHSLTAILVKRAGMHSGCTSFAPVARSHPARYIHRAQRAPLKPQAYQRQSLLPSPTDITRHKTMQPRFAGFVISWDLVSSVAKAQCGPASLMPSHRWCPQYSALTGLYLLAGQFLWHGSAGPVQALRNRLALQQWHQIFRCQVKVNGCGLRRIEADQIDMTLFTFAFYAALQ